MGRIPSLYRTSKKVTDHLANERTFLAWMRTGLATITFGFVVERFGLLLRELGFQGQPDHNLFRALFFIDWGCLDVVGCHDDRCRIGQLLAKSSCY